MIAFSQVNNKRSVDFKITFLSNIIEVELDALLEKKQQHFLTFKSIHILIKYMF